MSVATLTLLGTAGCQSENKSKTYPARGKVVYKGTGENATRLAGAQVTLELVSDPKSVQVRGAIDDDGTFSLGSIIDGQNVGGAVPGEYRGRIVLSDGGLGRRARPPIDPKYLTYDKSGIRVTLTAGKNEVIIEVEEQRR
jgi:hypothetical protein